MSTRLIYPGGRPNRWINGSFDQQTQASLALGKYFSAAGTRIVRRGLRPPGGAPPRTIELIDLFEGESARL